MTDFETPSIDFSNRDRALQQIWSYVQSFQEQVSFWLRNLDKDSFNEQGLKEITEPITAQIQDVAGNVTTLQVTAEGLRSSVADADGKATTAQQTAEGLSASVSNLSGEVSTVSATINGLNVTTSGGTTYISGDHIKSGTIEGVELISANTSSHTRIAGGNVLFGGVSSDEPALMYYEPSTEKLRINCGTAIKIEAGTNMSIDAGGTVYLQTNGGDINIGNGGNIRLNGTVMVNGVAL